MSKRKSEGQIPRVDFNSVGWTRFREIYSDWQAVVVEGCTSTAGAHAKWCLSELSSYYGSARARAVVDSKFCVEQADPGRRSKVTAEAVLGQARPTGNWYATWIVQHDQQVVDEALQSLPVSELQPGLREDSLGGDSDSRKLVHENCLWFFVARCDRDMAGRAEHTDGIEHDGTWHYQLRGAKRWYLRPTDQLLEMMAQTAHDNTCLLDKETAIVVECQAGEVLLINTALWWHRTEIPCTTRTPDGLSISYARDIYFPDESAGAKGKEKAEQRARAAAEDSAIFDMGNIDTFRAECFLEEGSVIFDQQDMPDVPIPRSTSPNCEFIIWEPTGAEVLIASRDISEGESLTVAGPCSPPKEGQGTA